jgi:lysozyme
MHTASPKAIQLIKSFEGLELKAYRCPANIPTIGYGQTGPDIKMGMTITEADANKLLLRDLTRRGAKLNELLGTSKTTQAQFDAMLSLMFNVGNAAFANSSVLRFHKEGRYSAAEQSFGLWVKATVKGKKVVLPGLVRRRLAESTLYGE